ncbi:MAG: TetR family transcriptional regulator [Acidimicrobiales bacterium]|nr:TetR family transcriptional regulator [Acidimicrobiales bacterium]
MTTVEPGTALSKSQAERRRRVIGAAIDLGAGGGYDAVQMRDLSARSDVALGTIYRYYSSKDHVLAEALVEWVEDLEGQIARRPPTGATTADRMVDILRRATRAMEREPKLSEAVITALAAADPKVIECQQVVGTTMARIQDRAFPDDFDVDTRAGIVRMLGWIWYAALVGWVNGWSGIGKVGDELELAARLLIEPHEA